MNQPTSLLPAVMHTFKFNNTAALSFHDGLSPDLQKVITPYEMFYLAQDWACRKYTKSMKFMKEYDSFVVLMHPDSSVEKFVESGEAIRYVPRPANEPNTINSERFLFFYDSKNKEQTAAVLWLPGFSSSGYVNPHRFSTHDERKCNRGDPYYYMNAESELRSNPVAMSKNMICELIGIERNNRGQDILGSDVLRLMPHEMFVCEKNLCRDLWDSLINDEKKPVKSKTIGSSICQSGKRLMTIGEYMELCGDVMIVDYNDLVFDAFHVNLTLNKLETFPIVSGLE